MSKQADKTKAVEDLETFLAEEYSLKEFMYDVAVIQQQMLMAMSYMDQDHLYIIDTRQISNFCFYAIRMGDILEPFTNKTPQDV